MEINNYGRQLSDGDINDDIHRDFVGGLWDVIGKLQFDFMLSKGLRPDMRFLDVGCGALRGGINFIDYLNSGNYYGLDSNKSLLKAGYEKELLQLGLQDKCPRSNLLDDQYFKFDRFVSEVDMALAISVFTHLPLNHIRLCFIELAKVMKPGGCFYATFFDVGNDHPMEEPKTHQPGGIVTHFTEDPYHYQFEDIHLAARDLPWHVEYLGDWDHPRAQKMVCLTRG